MILELVHLHVLPDYTDRFPSMVARGVQEVLTQAPGFVDLAVDQGLEDPLHFILRLHWRTLEDHTVTFREGPLFPQWRAVIGPALAGSPSVAHFEARGRHPAPEGAPDRP